jgi:predicted metalloprotease with PDZ domain
MAIYGKFSYTNEEAFSSISKIIMAERKFWSDPGSNYFFTLIMPTDDKGNYGGTAHFNSFSLFQSSDVQLNNGILQTISHEYFHNWIGSSGLKNPNPDEAYKWFSEGFTDYYSLKLLNKTGGITNADFIKKLNEDIREYYLSPHFNADSLSIIGKYWTDADWRQLPYRRGLTIALTLDLKIQEKNSTLSLDDLMKELYEQSKPSLFFSTTLFEKLVLKYGGQETLDDVHRAIHGQNETLTKALLNNKIFKTSQLHIHQIFDIGFDLTASIREKRIIGLEPGSNAEKAGLREGTPITGVVAGLRNNNTEKPGKVEVIFNNKKQWISFMPVAIVDLQVPQVD